MEHELHKLRIDKSHKARRDERAVWPWVIVVLLVIAGGAAGGQWGVAAVWAVVDVGLADHGRGAAVWQWRGGGGGPAVTTVRVHVPEGAVNEADSLLLNGTGYVMAAHKIELASKVIGRVAWVGVE